MTVPNTWVLFYVHEKEELYSEERIQAFCTRLSERNCSVTSETEIASRAIWQTYLVNAPEADLKRKGRQPFAEALKPQVSESGRRHIHTYVAEREEQLTLSVRSVALSSLVRGFAFSVTLAPLEGFLLLSIERERFFRATLKGLAMYRYWIRVIEETCACWKPLYAHEFSHMYTEANPSWEEVRRLTIPALSALNIYGSELIQQMGRERLLNAPAWLVRELDGSGCLLIPVDPYGFNPSASFTYENVARYLGSPVSDQPAEAVDASVAEAGERPVREPTSRKEDRHA